ncbi:DUF4304 domain-containing protein [Bradyrhizobium septentrionale]|uniref:DUF4304 domain-containing protein n=1 Tax=Bradyrhizobium septentrionale TaxID=1404411 RepID=A0A973W1K7_9BRAD|nr:DUF4304 domain-containing protein [Bradyrhizobium septentrionale]UGY14333.1 DUF4304 domain-containing protein [Bradyrhizobium septentrionale]UGY22961.1 DUF4304 domain-containing protein [Bradyrhizobium septentrionale]
MTSGKSDLAKSLDGVQGQLRPVLKDGGFRARDRTFNRTTSDGLTEVVKIQMGSFDPPGTTYVPGLRENLYGKFTINLGIFVPEVAEQNGGGAPKSFVQEYHCCIRTRLPVLGPEGRDVWWDIQAHESLAHDLRQRIERDAIPFFKKFETRDAILKQWLGVSKAPYASSPPRIVCAIILAGRGQKEDARILLAAQARETSIPGHAAHVRRLADKLGVADLAW